MGDETPVGARNPRVVLTPARTAGPTHTGLGERFIGDSGTARDGQQQLTVKLSLRTACARLPSPWVTGAGGRPTGRGEGGWRRRAQGPHVRVGGRSAGWEHVSRNSVQFKTDEWLLSLEFSTYYFQTKVDHDELKSWKAKKVSDGVAGNYPPSVSP